MDSLQRRRKMLELRRRRSTASGRDDVDDGTSSLGASMSAASAASTRRSIGSRRHGHYVPQQHPQHQHQLHAFGGTGAGEVPRESMHSRSSTMTTNFTTFVPPPPPPTAIDVQADATSSCTGTVAGTAVGSGSGVSAASAAALNLAAAMSRRGSDAFPGSLPNGDLPSAPQHYHHYSTTLGPAGQPSAQVEVVPGVGVGGDLAHADGAHSEASSSNYSLSHRHNHRRSIINRQQQQQQQFHCAAIQEQPYGGGSGGPQHQQHRHFDDENQENRQHNFRRQDQNNVDVRGSTKLRQNQDKDHPEGQQGHRRQSCNEIPQQLLGGKGGPSTGAPKPSASLGPSTKAVAQVADTAPTKIIVAGRGSPKQQTKTQQPPQQQASEKSKVMILRHEQHSILKTNSVLSASDAELDPSKDGGYDSEVCQTPTRLLAIHRKQLLNNAGPNSGNYNTNDRRVGATAAGSGNSEMIGGGQQNDDSDREHDAITNVIFRRGPGANKVGGGGGSANAVAPISSQQEQAADAAHHRLRHQHPVRTEVESSQPKTQRPRQQAYPFESSLSAISLTQSSVVHHDRHPNGDANNDDVCASDDDGDATSEQQPRRGEGKAAAALDTSSSSLDSFFSSGAASTPANNSSTLSAGGFHGHAYANTNDAVADHRRPTEDVDDDRELPGREGELGSKMESLPSDDRVDHHRHEQREREQKICHNSMYMSTTWSGDEEEEDDDDDVDSNEDNENKERLFDVHCGGNMNAHQNNDANRNKNSADTAASGQHDDKGDPRNLHLQHRMREDSNSTTSNNSATVKNRVTSTSAGGASSDATFFSPIHVNASSNSNGSAPAIRPPSSLSLSSCEDIVLTATRSGGTSGTSSYCGPPGDAGNTSPAIASTTPNTNTSVAVAGNASVLPPTPASASQVQTPRNHPRPPPSPLSLQTDQQHHGSSGAGGMQQQLTSPYPIQQRTLSAGAGNASLFSDVSSYVSSSSSEHSRGKNKKDDDNDSFTTVNDDECANDDDDLEGEGDVENNCDNESTSTHDVSPSVSVLQFADLSGNLTHPLEGVHHHGGDMIDIADGAASYSSSSMEQPPSAALSADADTGTSKAFPSIHHPLQRGSGQFNAVDVLSESHQSLENQNVNASSSLLMSNMTSSELSFGVGGNYGVDGGLNITHSDERVDDSSDGDGLVPSNDQTERQSELSESPSKTLQLDSRSSSLTSSDDAEEEQKTSSASSSSSSSSSITSSSRSSSEGSTSSDSSNETSADDGEHVEEDDFQYINLTITRSSDTHASRDASMSTQQRHQQHYRDHSTPPPPPSLLHFEPHSSPRSTSGNGTSVAQMWANSTNSRTVVVCNRSRRAGSDSNVLLIRSRSSGRAQGDHRQQHRRYRSDAEVYSGQYYPSTAFPSVNDAQNGEDGATQMLVDRPLSPECRYDPCKAETADDDNRRCDVYHQNNQIDEVGGQKQSPPPVGEVYIDTSKAHYHVTREAMQVKQQSEHEKQRNHSRSKSMTYLHMITEEQNVQNVSAGSASHNDAREEHDSSCVRKCEEQRFRYYDACSGLTTEESSGPVLHLESPSSRNHPGHDEDPYEGRARAWSWSAPGVGHACNTTRRKTKWSTLYSTSPRAEIHNLESSDMHIVEERHVATIERENSEQNARNPTLSSSTVSITPNSESALSSSSDFRHDSTAAKFVQNDAASSCFHGNSAGNRCHIETKGNLGISHPSSISQKYEEKRNRLSSVLPHCSYIRTLWQFTIAKVYCPFHILGSARQKVLWILSHDLPEFYSGMVVGVLLTISFMVLLPLVGNADASHLSDIAPSLSEPKLTQLALHQNFPHSVVLPFTSYILTHEWSIAMLTTYLLQMVEFFLAIKLDTRSNSYFEEVRSTSHPASLVVLGAVGMIWGMTLVKSCAFPCLWREVICKHLPDRHRRTKESNSASVVCLVAIGYYTGCVALAHMSAKRFGLFGSSMYTVYSSLGFLFGWKGIMYWLTLRSESSDVGNDDSSTLLSQFASSSAASTPRLSWAVIQEERFSPYIYQLALFLMIYGILWNVIATDMVLMMSAMNKDLCLLITMGTIVWIGHWVKGSNAFLIECSSQQEKSDDCRSFRRRSMILATKLFLALGAMFCFYCSRSEMRKTVDQGIVLLSIQ